MTSGAVPSKILLRLSGDPTPVKAVADKITKLVEANVKAEAHVRVHTKDEVLPSAVVKSMARKRVLMFGSGRVAKPVMRLFQQSDNTRVTIASDDRAQAEDLASVFKGDPERVSFELFRFPEHTNKLARLVKDADVVISLLPATMHMPIAEEALKQRRHLVTASYVSPAMQALHRSAQDAGVILLNEVGLDPGIDHMLIMKSVDDIHRRGGVITDMVSLCGGLPDPVAADNPLRYKISWSPKGMLNAAQNSARYSRNGELVNIAGDQLLRSATKTGYFPTLRLEVIPNRDSMMYKELYGVLQATNVCRGTLRYEGWANAMYGLKSLGLFDSSNHPQGVTNWKDLLKSKGGSKSPRELLLAAGVEDVDHALEAAEWLGVLSDQPLAANTPIDSLCKVMEQKLQFQNGEKDMVAMYHRVSGRMPDGSTETHSSRLLAFGNPGPDGDSAMAETVGYTTAAAAEMILNGQLISRSGVIIPTTEDIYQPMLKRINDFGIYWTEDITKSK